jgi:pimeloyl-ACP methyl ester carboxylesterase
MYVRVFAHLFPLDTAGIVLVDSGPDSFYEILQLEDAVVWDALVEDLKKRAPAGAKAQLEVNAASVEQARRSWPLPRVPLVSISATKPEPPVFTAERRKRITTLQREVLRHIAGAQHIEATGCGHNIPVECSEIVGNAVLQVLAVIRRQRHPERP